MKSNIFISRAVIVATLVAFAVGCSEFGAPTASVSTDVSTSSLLTSPGTTPQENVSYPPISDVIANVEASGYRVVTPRRQAALDDECDSVIVDRYARINQGGSLSMQGLVRLQWAPGVIPSNLVLTIVAPSDCIGAADFYPHPTFFNGFVDIVWDMRALDLPDDFDFSTIIPLYIHDDGTPEEVSYFWRSDSDDPYRFLVVQTNHFSRYIITRRVTG